MHKWIAIACVLGWSFFAVFGCLAVMGLSEGPGFQTLIAAELALYGLAVGCVTWAYICSSLREHRKARASRHTIRG